MFSKTKHPLCVRLSLVGLLTFILMSGCGGNSSKTYPLSGTVTYQGNPVPVGGITLMPDPSKGNKGPMGFATIKDGKFTTAEGKGVVGGAYILEIKGYTGVPIQSGEGGQDPNGAPLFPQSTLNVELPPKGEPLEIKVPVQRPRQPSGE